MILPRPKWLNWFPAGCWVTLSPNIYYPPSIRDPQRFPSIIAHEEVHLRQQSKGLAWWLVRYILSRSFRLDQEAEAFAVELKRTPDSTYAVEALGAVAVLLASRQYLWAASSVDKAKAALYRHMNRIGSK